MTDAHDFVIRPLAGADDYDACVALQYDTWGKNFREVVPPSLLMVCQKIGGVAAGAFTREGVLAGFVFGMTGVQDGRIVHWSDMLAVRPEYRNTGLGRRLKEHQREAVSEVGAQAILWTFDPLVARNAHINFNVLGTSALEYVPNMYGENTGSALHGGVGTDRLVVEWPVNQDQSSLLRRMMDNDRSAREFETCPVLGDPDDAPSRHPTDYVRIVVPGDVEALMAKDPQRVIRWRVATREAFLSCLAREFVVCGFTTSEGRGYYLLVCRPIG